MRWQTDRETDGWIGGCWKKSTNRMSKQERLLKIQSSLWGIQNAAAHINSLNISIPLGLILPTADWLNHRPPGHQDKRDPAGIGGSDQDRQSDRQHQWPSRHHHRHTDSHQPGSVPNHFMVSIQTQASIWSQQFLSCYYLRNSLYGQNWKTHKTKISPH